MYSQVFSPLVLPIYQSSLGCNFSLSASSGGRGLMVSLFRDVDTRRPVRRQSWDRDTLGCIFYDDTYSVELSHDGQMLPMVYHPERLASDIAAQAEHLRADGRHIWETSYAQRLSASSRILYRSLATYKSATSQPQLFWLLTGGILLTFSIPMSTSTTRTPISSPSKPPNLPNSGAHTPDPPMNPSCALSPPALHAIRMHSVSNARA